MKQVKPICSNTDFLCARKDIASITTECMTINRTVGAIVANYNRFKRSRYRYNRGNGNDDTSPRQTNPPH